MKKHFLSITLLLAPAAMFAMDADGEPGVVEVLRDAAPLKTKKVKATPQAQVVQQDEEQAVEEDEWVEPPVQQLVKAKKKQQAAQAEELQEASGVVEEEVATGPTSAVAAATQAAPAEEQKDESVEAAYQRGLWGAIGLALTGNDKTTYVQKYFRCNARCATACDHPITIPANMLVQLTNDRNKAIMSEQTEAIKGLRSQNDGSIPSQHVVQRNIHSGPVQKLGALVRGSKQTTNFELKDVNSIKRVNTLLRNEDAADFQLLADAYDMIQMRMQERKAIRATLHAQKPKESEIVLSDTEYDNDEQFVAKFQGYRSAKKAAEKAAKK